VEIMVGVRAIEEGKAGDSIRVENTQTRKILRGKILNEKLISIDDGKQ
jgi:flagella basal body P-ring formation protein FlgA